MSPSVSLSASAHLIDHPERHDHPPLLPQVDASADSAPASATFHVRPLWKGVFIGPEMDE
jgi:hypothetical protein